jgi:hypothetical protein
MTSPMSRRWFVAAVGGLTGAASAALVWRSRRVAAAPPADAPDAASLRFVDRDGWMLTPDDQRRLAQGAGESPGR